MPAQILPNKDLESRIYDVSFLPSPRHQRQFQGCCSSARQQSQKESSPVWYGGQSGWWENDSNLGGGGTPAPGARGTTGKDSSRSSLRLPSSSSRAENFSKPCHKSRGILNKYPPGKHFLKPKLNFNYIRSVFGCSFSGTASSKRES